MAKNNKRISINSLDNVMKEKFNNRVVDTWNDIEVVMKRSISITETLEFVNNVVMSCFSDSNGFMPEVMDFAVKSNILTKYANFSLPDNLEHRHEIVYCSDAVRFVCQHINMEQLNEIMKSINKKIAYLCNTNTIGIQKQLTELVGSFEKMQESTVNMFSNITPEDITKIVGALDKGVLDEDKLVQAYLKHTTHPEALTEVKE